jgi:hypothetical protein
MITPTVKVQPILIKQADNEAIGYCHNILSERKWNNCKKKEQVSGMKSTIQWRKTRSQSLDFAKQTLNGTSTEQEQL